MFTAPPLYTLPIILAFVFYQVCTRALPRFFLVPTHNWKDKIQSTIDYPKPIYLKVGAKRSSFRRRLVAASEQPSYYTNFTNNKLKLQPHDALNENNAFMERLKIRGPKDPRRKIIYGFFHPYANNGGGGEKVLWHAVQATLLEDERNVVVIYVTSATMPLDILQQAQEKFHVMTLDPTRILFIYLRKFNNLIDANYWKHFTMAGQLLGSVLLGLEAMYELSPDVWVDTMGLPGSYWLVSLILKIPIMAYVHYPIIQPEMFNKLKFNSILSLTKIRPSFTDLKQLAKFFYWSILYYIYVYLGSCVDITLANGTWTYDHISKIWFMNGAKVMHLLYPPCSTEHLISESKAKDIPRLNQMVYVAQFRPEKRHQLVLDEYKKFLKSAVVAKASVSQIPKLVLLGSCRTPDDTFTLESLQKYVKDSELQDYVEFIVGSPFETVKMVLGESKFGINAMWNEHFGICVVEYISAGLIPIVHASAGPLLDITNVDGASNSWVNELGYFFKSESDPDFSANGVSEDEDVPANFPTLAQVLSKLFLENASDITEQVLQKKRDLGAKMMMEKFSDKQFTTCWMKNIGAISQMEEFYRELRRDKVGIVY